MTKKNSKKPESDNLKKGQQKTNSNKTGAVKEEGVPVADKPEEVQAEGPVEKEKSNEEIIKELQEKYIRLSADFDNYRKRTLREKIDLTKLASEEVLLKLLPVIDDFERALQTMNEVTDCKAMKEGIDLIHNKFKEFFFSNGVKEIKALNEKFDTDLHEAITKIPAPSKKLKGKIVDVIEKGYFLHDKVIRYSKVVIGE
jgi:molecular chaperone GrpE